MTTIEKITKFVNQRPGLEFANYGNISAYRQESAEITRDRADFFELLSFAFIMADNLEQELTDYLTNNSGRLTLKDGEIEYCTGQYFPTEYRPAACAALRSIIWRHLSNTYATGLEIRKAAKRRLSRRVVKNYFN